MNLYSNYINGIAEFCKANSYKALIKTTCRL